MTDIDSAAPRGTKWRKIGWGGAVALLLLPLVANAPWTLSDYLFAGLMFGVVGLALELAVRASGSLAYRVGVGFEVAAVILLIWVNGAVGMFGSEDNPGNLIFFAVIALAVLGSVLAQFKPAGMARAMFAAATAQALIAVYVLIAGLDSVGAQGWYEVALGTTMFVSLWLLSAGLFRKAAQEEAAATA